MVHQRSEPVKKAKDQGGGTASTVEVFLTLSEVEPHDVQDRTAVVVDVLRTTSTIVEALSNGAKAIYPTVSAEDAIRLASSLGRDDTLLCGERKGLKIEGYDLGNSPLDFTPENVRDRRLVMSTTNGTRALVAAAGARRVVVASFLNLEAVVRAVFGEPRIVILCAAKEDRFSMDDAVCAGRIVQRLESSARTPVELNDGARAAYRLADGVTPDASFLGSTDAGRALTRIGRDEDLEICAEVDRHSVVPEMHDRVVRA